MRKKTVLTCLFVAVICITFVTLLLLYNSDDTTVTDINEDVVDVKSFNIVDEGTGTYTDGTVFIINSNGDLKVKVIAELFIGDQDFGGVTYSMEHLGVSSVFCDYRFEDDSTAYVHTLDHLGEYGRVEVASSQEPTGGGKGYIEVEFGSTNTLSPSGHENLELIIGVGSKILPGGTKVWGNTTETIVIEH